MTSYTKKLFDKNPGAAKELRKTQLHQLRYGRHVTLAQFTLGPDEGAQADEERAKRRARLQRQMHQPPFGRRVSTGAEGCMTNCGEPACSHGCTLYRHGK